MPRKVCSYYPLLFLLIYHFNEAVGFVFSGILENNE
jgi:hypothetical protein